MAGDERHHGFQNGIRRHHVRHRQGARATRDGVVSEPVGGPRESVGRDAGNHEDPHGDQRLVPAARDGSDRAEPPAHRLRLDDLDRAQRAPDEHERRVGILRDRCEAKAHDGAEQIAPGEVAHRAPEVVGGDEGPGRERDIGMDDLAMGQDVRVEGEQEQGHGRSRHAPQIARPPEHEDPQQDAQDDDLELGEEEQDLGVVVHEEQVLRDVDRREAELVLEDEIPVRSRRPGILQIEQQQRKGGPHLRERRMLRIGPVVAPFERRVARHEMSGLVDRDGFLKQAGHGEQAEDQDEAPEDDR